MVVVSVGQLAKVSLATSITVSLTALLLAFLKPQAHMILASTAISITFPLTVYIPFLAGLKGGSPRRGFEGLSAIASVTLAMLTPLIALIFSYRLALVIGALGVSPLTVFPLAGLGLGSRSSASPEPHGPQSSPTPQGSHLQRALKHHHSTRTYNT